MQRNKRVCLRQIGGDMGEVSVRMFGLIPRGGIPNENTTDTRRP